MGEGQKGKIEEDQLPGEPVPLQREGRGGFFKRQKIKD